MHFTTFMNKCVLIWLHIFPDSNDISECLGFFRIKPFQSQQSTGMDFSSYYFFQKKTHDFRIWIILGLWLAPDYPITIKSWPVSFSEIWGERRSRTPWLMIDTWDPLKPQQWRFQRFLRKLLWLATVSAKKKMSFKTIICPEFMIQIAKHLKNAKRNLRAKCMQ